MLLFALRLWTYGTQIMIFTNATGRKASKVMFPFSIFSYSGHSHFPTPVSPRTSLSTKLANLCLFYDTSLLYYFWGEIYTIWNQKSNGLDSSPSSATIQLIYLNLCFLRGKIEMIISINSRCKLKGG